MFLSEFFENQKNDIQIDIHFDASTLEILDKQYAKFDQGLDFLNFYLGHRGKNQEKPQNN